MSNFPLLIIALIIRLVEGVLFSIVGIIGFLGNTLSILVLISPQVIDCNPYKAGYGPDPTNISSQSSSEFDWWSVEAVRHM